MTPRKLGLSMLTLDTARMGEAFARPGSDPRTWTTLAIVTAVNVTAEGVYVDITTIAGIEETASVVSAYGGPGFGLYCPVAVDDWVLVEVPEGDWNAGARVVAQVWDAGTPPPQEAIDNPRDVALVIEPGQSIRIIVSGGGNAVIEARDGGRVQLGAEGASEAVLLGDAFVTWLQTLVTAISSAIGSITAGAPAGGGAAAAAITTALTTFIAQSGLYKSTRVKVAL